MCVHVYIYMCMYTTHVCIHTYIPYIHVFIFQVDLDLPSAEELEKHYLDEMDAILTYAQYMYTDTCTRAHKLSGRPRPCSKIYRDEMDVIHSYAHYMHTDTYTYTHKLSWTNQSKFTAMLHTHTHTYIHTNYQVDRDLASVDELEQVYRDEMDALHTCAQ